MSQPTCGCVVGVNPDGAIRGFRRECLKARELFTALFEANKTGAMSPEQLAATADLKQHVVDHGFQA